MEHYNGTMSENSRRRAQRHLVFTFQRHIFTKSLRKFNQIANKSNFLPIQNTYSQRPTTTLSVYGIITPHAVSKHMSDIKMPNTVLRHVLVLQVGSGLFRGAKIKKCIYGIYKVERLYRFLRGTRVSDIIQPHNRVNWFYRCCRCGSRKFFIFVIPTPALNASFPDTSRTKYDSVGEHRF